MRTAPLLAAALVLVLSACASEPPSRPPPPRSEPPSESPTPLPQARDQCGAAEWRHLIGRPRSEVPVPVMPALQRVACTTCPVTLDFNPRRLNFFYEAETGLIKEVKCG
jgi:hypothetical protein